MGSWEVMKIRGIPLRIHPSWFLVFLYFTLSAKDQFETLLNGQASIWNGWVIGACTSSLFVPEMLSRFKTARRKVLNAMELAQKKGISITALGGFTSIQMHLLTKLN